MDKMHRGYRKCKGLTLVELLVVISVMTILALILLVNYRGYNKQNQLREAAQGIRSAFVETQNMALAPKEIIYKGTTQIPKGYGLAFIRSAGPPETMNFFRFADLNGDQKYIQEDDLSLGYYYTMPKNLSAALIPSDVQSILFTTPNSKTYLTHSSGNANEYNELFHFIIGYADNWPQNTIDIQLNGVTGQINIQ